MHHMLALIDEEPYMCIWNENPNMEISLQKVDRYLCCYFVLVIS